MVLADGIPRHNVNHQLIPIHCQLSHMPQGGHREESVSMQFMGQLSCGGGGGGGVSISATCW